MLALIYKIDYFNNYKLVTSFSSIFIYFTSSFSPVDFYHFFFFFFASILIIIDFIDSYLVLSIINFIERTRELYRQ